MNFGNRLGRLEAIPVETITAIRWCKRVAELEAITKRGKERLAKRLKPELLPVFTPEYLDSLNPAEFKKLHDKYGDPEMDAWLDSLTPKEIEEMNLKL